MGESKNSATFLLFSQDHGHVEFMCEMESIVNDYQRGDAAHRSTTELRQNLEGFQFCVRLSSGILPKAALQEARTFLSGFITVSWSEAHSQSQYGFVQGPVICTGL